MEKGTILFQATEVVMVQLLSSQCELTPWPAKYEEDAMPNSLTPRFRFKLMLLGALCQWIIGNPLNAHPTQNSRDQGLDGASKSGVFYGPGLLSNSKEIVLQASWTSEVSEKTLQVGEGDESFSDVKNWISKNVLTALNQPGCHFDGSADYSLFLFSERKNGMTGFLISIPLGQGLLGARFSEKLKELHDLMNIKKSSNR
ncbi:MAG: hypothetical protein J0M35_12805 [Candidatus Obscuribacter phosphatis]|uniref:Uncharacterized protein n=1 Tax=Candidatus Obscuribacter phosphatis TaxID=1906157 RepID=A0A8J7TM22_9BACT|nr:hypothetical protein [Candidatus Obscuribacter phosphatis]